MPHFADTWGARRARFRGIPSGERRLRASPGEPNLPDAPFAAQATLSPALCRVVRARRAQRIAGGMDAWRSVGMIGSPFGAAVDSMVFSPPLTPGDERIEIQPTPLEENVAWLRAPFGDNLLTDPAQWRSG